MKRILLITIAFLMISNVSADLDGYNCSKEIILTGNTSGAQTDYQILLNISYEDNMQSNFSDLCFTETDGTTLMDAWLESKVDNSYALVWVEFPTTPVNIMEQTYYMYYGNAEAASNWDGEATFVLYTGLKTTNWVSSLDISGHGYAYRGDVQYDTLATEFDFGFGDSAIRDPSNSIHLANYDNGAQHRRIVRVADAWGLNIYNEGIIWSINTPYIYDIIFGSSDCKFYKDGIQVGSTYSGNTPTVNMGIFNYYFTGAGQVNWQFIRKYASNPPTYEFGAEVCEEEVIPPLTTIRFYYPCNNTTTDIKYISNDGYNVTTSNYLSAENLSVIIIKDQIVSEDIITNPSKLMDIKYFTLFVFLTLFIVSIIALIKIIKRGA